MIYKVISLILISSLSMAETTVNVRAKNKIGTVKVLKLEHIATVTSDSAEDTAQLNNIVIDEDWKSGQSVNLQSHMVVQQIQQESRKLHLTSKPKYEIPKFILVESSLQIVDDAEAKKKIENYLYSLCNDCEFKIKVLNIPKLTAENPADVQWNLDLSQVKLTRNMSIPVNIDRVDQHKKIWINVELEIFKSMPVATRQLNVGQRVQPEDIKYKKIEIINKLDWIENESDLIGQALDKPIAFGWPIYKSDLKREPAVNRGQVVKVSMGNDDLEITTQAYAEAQGFIGDMVNLKTVDGAKLISGRIIEKGIVRVE